MDQDLIDICNIRDQFIVMATDGFWEVMENKEVANSVGKFKSLCTESSGVKNPG